MADALATGAKFRKAVEEDDLVSARECMSENVEFHSPVAFKHYSSLETVMPLLTHVSQTFEDFVYLDDLHSGSSHLLRFQVRLGDQ